MFPRISPGVRRRNKKRQNVSISKVTLINCLKRIKTHRACSTPYRKMIPYDVYDVIRGRLGSEPRA